MPCHPDVLRRVPLFALLDDEEAGVLASLVELKTFAPRQRIYRAGDAGGNAYVLVSGAVQVTTVDEDQQGLLLESPGPASSSASPPCWNRHRIKPRQSRWSTPNASKWTGTTSRCCSSASRWRGWICWRSSDGNSTRRSSWCVSAPIAIRMS